MAPDQELCFDTAVMPRHRANQLTCCICLIVLFHLKPGYSRVCLCQCDNSNPNHSASVAANTWQLNVEALDGGIEAGMILAATKAVQQGGVLLSFPTDLGFKQATSVGVVVCSTLREV